ncbi:MAG: metal ABC transporter permease [Bacteroidales bacterium]|nr:metal ABC transporter permease [Bacteroidales bacterium]
MLELFEYQFFVRAFLAAVLASVACGFIGTYIVSRGLVFLSGGIVHASFGGIGIAIYLGLNPIFGASVFSIVSAFAIQYATSKSQLRNDSAIAMLWSLGMAIGIIFIYLTPGYAPNLMSYLFGNILTVSGPELWVLFVLTIIVMGVFIGFQYLIMFASFDEVFAQSRQLPVFFINALLLILVAFTIVLNIKTVGIILILSLITVPPNIAMLFSKDYKNTVPGCFIWPCGHF